MTTTAHRAVTVAVIGGGRNSEHTVSVHSAAGVAQALRERGYGVKEFLIARDGGWSCDDRRLAGGLSEAVAVLASCDVVFPALHGTGGEDGSLAALCRLADVPCVGSGVLAGAVGMDKPMAKLIAAAVGIETARCTVVTVSSPSPDVELPVVVKPVSAGSSHGVTKVTRSRDLGAAIDGALAFGGRAMVEEYVHGREIDVAVVVRSSGELLVGPPLEVELDERGIFNERQKYSGEAVFHCPARLAPRLRLTVQDAARRLYTAFGCAGVARIDFILDDERLVFNEINTMPGLTPHSQVPRIFGAVGVGYEDLIADLVETARSGGAG